MSILPRSLRPSVLLALAALLSAGCASDIETNAIHDPLARFPPQATWSWDDAASLMSGDERIATPEIAERLKRVTAEEFARRGYRETPAAQASYRLSYELAFHTRIGVDRSFSIASLSLHLSEAASGRRVWVGFARAEVTPGPADPESAKLREALHRILADFPPQT